MREVPIISYVCMIATAVLVTLFVAPLSQPVLADSAFKQGAVNKKTRTAGGAQLTTTPRYLRPQQTLGERDELATLEVVHRALTETADGETFVWRAAHGRLNAILQPTTSFMDRHQRVCRHVVIMLNSGLRSQRAEGIACRLESGTWSLAG
ncbi:MAG: hypothetical protein AAGD43_30420 [Pseudomonadota bacterium]